MKYNVNYQIIEVKDIYGWCKTILFVIVDKVYIANVI